MILKAVWIRQGKRLRRRYYIADKFMLYGQKFRHRFKEILNEEFIKEAGLDNRATFNVVCESLRTDYGLVITKIGDWPEVKKKAKAKAKSSNGTRWIKPRSKTRE